MVEKTRFKVKFYARETAKEKEYKAHNPSSCEGKFIVTPNYHFTHYKVRIKIVPSQGYNFAYLDCYALNVD